MKKQTWAFFLLALLGLLPHAGRASTQPEDSIRFSLLTCAPGEAIYSLFGHTAIRYENLAEGIDMVLNYGIFSFDSPHFVMRFALGETDYRLGAEDYAEFEAEYRRYGRSVCQQTLNLTPEEKRRLLGLLEENYRPQNRVYRYNYFYDNCSTRPRDRIEEALGGKVFYPDTPADYAYSYRDIVHQYCKGHSWARFGIDLCIGSEADLPITRRQMMFAPFYLMNAFDEAKKESAGERQPLVTETVTLVDIPNPQAGAAEYFTPFQCALLLLIATAAATLYGIRRGKGLWGIDLVLFSVAGLAGCLLAFLALFSEHPTVGSNYMLLMLHPLHLFATPFIICRVRRKKRSAYLVFVALSLTLFMLLLPVLPQKFDITVVPLALCLLVRSVSNLVLTYTRKA